MDASVLFTYAKTSRVGAVLAFLGRRAKCPPAVPLGLLVIVALLSSDRSVYAAPVVPVVRPVYLVPTDREVKAEYQSAIMDALYDLQQWYADQLDGSTFAISPAVDIVSGLHPSSFYSTNDTGGEYSTWFFYNVINDAFTMTGGQYNDPLHRWIFYVDADNAPGQFGGAALWGAAVLPGADLRGLIGEQPQPVSRWIGGLGHELGHTFGLPHPSACEPVYTAACPIDALMWTGYLTYPDAYLLAEDKALLRLSPFIGSQIAVAEPGSTSLLAVSLAWAAAGARAKARRRIAAQAKSPSRA